MLKKKLESWVLDERAKVEQYLVDQKVTHLGVGEWPAFEDAPRFAIWAIQSKAKPGYVGWWAISGDCPTDYMSRGRADHPRKVIKHFSVCWNRLAKKMKAGKADASVRIGQKKDWPTLGPLLEKRAEYLAAVGADEGVWEAFDN